MPLIRIETSVAVTHEMESAFLSAVSKMLSECTGKPEEYVMVTLIRAPVLMAGDSQPAVFADIRAIGGLTPEVNRQLSKRFCELMSKWFNVAGKSVYMNFTDVNAANWGVNGTTFG